MTSSLFCQLEGPHDQLSHLSSLLSVNGRNGASAVHTWPTSHGVKRSRLSIKGLFGPQLQHPVKMTPDLVV